MDSLSPLTTDAPPSNSVAGDKAAKYKLMSPAKLPISRSPCITIPAGLSPTSFLESPVLLSNMKVEPSPTTGSFFKHQMLYNPVDLTSHKPPADCSNTETSVEEKSDCFEFKPYSGSNMVPYFPNHQAGQQSVQIQGQCPLQSFTSSASTTSKMVASFDDKSSSSPANMVTSGTTVPAESDLDDSNQKDSTDSVVQASHADQKGLGLCDDGYNWRKYGQKLVKGSEFPRSYYKCTYPNCEVKKLFERSHDGQITEIVYKGTHDHPKPQPSRRYSSGMIASIQDDNSDKTSCLSGHEDKSFNVRDQTCNAIVPNATMGQSARETNDEIEGLDSQPNRIHDEDADDDDDDPLSKRRKMEGLGIDVAPMMKPIREPRVVVQTVSEVDILDDGYRWRKYGQKVVRGNPNPRSYYKCTSVGCPVRKHVERASHDPKAVITTYEGKHNHDVPTARNSNHDAAASVSLGGQSRINTEGSETISLNLGVGMSTAADYKSNELRPTLHPDVIRNHHSGNSNYTVVNRMPVSAYYGVLNNSVNHYGSRGNQNESHSVEISPINHASQYPQNINRLLMGP